MANAILLRLFLLQINKIRKRVAYFAECTLGSHTYQNIGSAVLLAKINNIEVSVAHIDNIYLLE